MADQLLLLIFEQRSYIAVTFRKPLAREHVKLLGHQQALIQAHRNNFWNRGGALADR